MKIKRSGPAPAQQAAPRRKSGALYWVALAFFALLFIVSAALLGRRLWEDHEVRSDFADLEALIEPAAPAADDGAQSDNAARFAALVARNPDFIGWISIDATNLSFPTNRTFTCAMILRANTAIPACRILTRAAR